MLQQRALDKGHGVAGYVERLIESDVLATQSFDAILVPIRQGFRQSGASEEEADALFEEAREEVFRERRAEAE